MARYLGSSCRLCRAEEEKLFLKGSRCYSTKCSMTRRSGLPGQHGQNRRKVSEYARQLRAKQKARRYYGVLEKQFRHYYDLALKFKEGKTGENMLSMLESRLDSVVYQLHWGQSKAHARQLVLHGHFLINEKRINIPSYLVQIGDIVSLSEKGKKSEPLRNLISSNLSQKPPKWIEFCDGEHFKAKKIFKPQMEDIGLEFDETLIVELFSK
ncbi:MAG: 30S ribosomal protein S4 [Candidatus Improbicoccus pseudotrichonymphae]|uniref:Small ribosomal subunit protein uS4 n=1 Tax=Candidatus Improbicoccus pseudotrichonymphae TaxID=3033792 RepID=A0AA48KYU6_9FIRM|nr:MAG: 30S ribosomal protein S4 [Candidatus Improbicoccus pseudotrichonymphae]